MSKPTDMTTGPSFTPDSAGAMEYERKLIVQWLRSHWESGLAQSYANAIERMEHRR